VIPVAKKLVRLTAKLPSGGLTASGRLQAAARAEIMSRRR